MKRLTTNIAALALALPLSACTGGGGDSELPGSPDAGIEEDTEAPTLLSTSPVDGAQGQLDTVQIVLSFSEPMNRSSVQDAIDSDSLGAVSQSWNAAGDELTLSPVTPLIYAEGFADPNSIVATEYDFILGSGAEDLAGNALEVGEGLAVNFTTLRRVGLVLRPDAELSRVATPSDLLFNTTDPFVVGDRMGDVTEEAMRSALSFDLSIIPEEAVSIESATLATRQLLGDLQGTPFTDLGAVLLDHVSYTTANVNGTFNADMTAHSTVGTFFVEGQISIETDVSAQVHDDLLERVERADLSQFLAYFETITDLESDNDRAVFSRDLLELSVSYLLP